MKLILDLDEGKLKISKELFFKEFFSPNMREFTMRMTHLNNHAVDDLLQDAALKILLNWQKVFVLPLVEQKRYAAAVIRNLYYDQFKKEKRQDKALKFVAHNSEYYEAPICISELKEVVASKNARLLKAIDILEKQPNKDVMYDYCNGMKFKDIAAKKKLNLGTVLGMSFRIRRDVKKEAAAFLALLVTFLNPFL